MTLNNIIDVVQMQYYQWHNISINHILENIAHVHYIHMNYSIHDAFTLL